MTVDISFACCGLVGLLVPRGGDRELLLVDAALLRLDVRLELLEALQLSKFMRAMLN